MHRLNRLLNPDSVAVVGGSWGRSVIAQLQRMDYQGQIWPVHPKHAEISGLTCFDSIESLPAAPDACFIGVNRLTTIEVVSALAACGAGGAVCFASGFSEALAEDKNSALLQQSLLDSAGDLPIIGPNCYGFINYLDGALLWPDLHGGVRVDSGVAIITQSSNIAINITMQQRALPIAYVLTAGNQAQTSIAELGMAVLQDPRVTALGMHIEGFGQIDAFEQLARQARDLGKGIVAIKAGRSQQSQQAMISHTNSLSGSDASSDALLSRLGIARVESLPVLLETLKLLHVFGRLTGSSIASMSCSGGEAGLMADAAHSRSLQYKPLTAAKEQALRKVLGPMVALANPLDYHTYIWNQLPEMTATFEAMLVDGADLTFLVIDFPEPDLAGAESWMVAVDALIAAVQNTRSPVAVLASLPENIPDSVAKRLLAEGIPSLYGIEEAMDATVAMASLGPPGSTGLASAPVHLCKGSCSQAVTLSEHQSKRLLQQAGVVVPDFRLVANVDAAIQAAAEIGYPLVVKLVGEAHKTEHDGVILNLRNAAELTAAVAALSEKSDQLLVESYCDDSVAELLVGIVREESGLLMLTIGAGGVLTELIRDTRNLLLPVTIDEINSAINELQIATLLQGYRNKPAADLAAVAKQVYRLCEWAIGNANDLQEVEINPLICQRSRAIAADALIRMRPVV